MTLRASAALAATVAACIAATAAEAAFTPAWTYVPATLRADLAIAEGGTLYLPARTPSFYRYRSGAHVSAGVLSVPFTNRVRVRAGVWRWTSQTFLWRVQRVAGDCSTWRTNDKTLQIDGNKVYSGSTPSGGSIAWRCVTDRRGRRLVLSASSARGDAGIGMGLVVASGLDVSRRTGAVTVALHVAPSSVHRGGTLLVTGVAGDCTAGNAVTIISHAFPATHSFAGVPAIFGQVGAAGRFSAKTYVPKSRLPGTYTVTARCGGGNLGVAARLTVV